MGKCWGITKKLRFCRCNAGERWLCRKHEAQPRYFAIVALISMALSYSAGLIPKPWKDEVDAIPDRSASSDLPQAVRTEMNTILEKLSSVAGGVSLDPVLLVRISAPTEGIEGVRSFVGDGSDRISGTVSWQRAP